VAVPSPRVAPNQTDRDDVLLPDADEFPMCRYGSHPGLVIASIVVGIRVMAEVLFLGRARNGNTNGSFSGFLTLGDLDGPMPLFGWACSCR
jgi:hypothetical protein